MVIVINTTQLVCIIVQKVSVLNATHCHYLTDAYYTKTFTVKYWVKSPVQHYRDPTVTEAMMNVNRKCEVHQLKYNEE